MDWRALLAALLILGGGLAQEAPASAPAAASPVESIGSSGSLDAAASQPPPGTIICTFDLQGATAVSNNTVTAASIDPTSAGAGLSVADIKCSGGDNITIQGGPALASFSAAWQGVTYVQNTQLPGSTMTLRGVDMVIKNSSFAGLQSFGSAAIAFAASNVTFMNSTFTMNNNSAAGCIYANESSLITILDSNFTNNAGLSAGSVALWNSTVTVNNTVFVNNTCNSQGGALMVYNSTDTTVSQSTFTSNNATNGGAIYLEVCDSATVYENVFTSNVASKSGGAVFQLQCPGSFLSNTFRKNAGTNGGAIWHNNIETVNHTLNLFVSNSGKNGSGGIELNQVNSMSVNSCNFTGGKGSKGGAIYTQDVAGHITNTYFGGNTASTNGGAIFRGTSTGDISTCDFISNSAASDGGAIYDSHVQGAINSSNTFSKNTAREGGAAIFRTTSSGTINGTGLTTANVQIENPGDIFENVFSLSTSKNGSITGVFRTVCSGSVTGNPGLPSSQVENANPSG